MAHLLLMLLLAFPALHSGLPNGMGDNRKSIEKQGNTNRDGIVYFSADNGETWQNKSDGLPPASTLGLGGIAVSANSVVLATKESGLFIFDFRGNSWRSIPTDKMILENNPGALIVYKDKIFLGTQYNGVFSYSIPAKNWISDSEGLTYTTIRKLVEMDHTLYAGTNGGLYSYNEALNRWEFEFGHTSLQVNGMTGFGEHVLIATNQGVYKSRKGSRAWKQVLADRSVHNISSDEKSVYAMVYNELFSSRDNGESWQSIQKGLPEGLYTFNVLNNGNAVFAGQWDGIYKIDPVTKAWILSSNGLPKKFAVTNLKLYNGILIIGTSERKQ